MYCNKCNEPLKNNIQVCPYCGATQPKSDNQPVQVDFSQFQSQNNQSVAVQSSNDMPTSYYVDSWLLFGLCMLYGIIRGLIGFSNGDDMSVYKGLIACGAACIFIPAIKVGINNPVVNLLVKILIAGAVVILI